MKDNQSGITIVELMISVAIATSLVAVLSAISIGFFGSTVRSQVTAQMATDSHFMLRAMVEDLRLGNSIGATNTLADSHAPMGGWATDDATDVLIINLPAITASNDIIYDTDTGDPYSNEYVYFVSNRTMYKRIIKNTAAPGNNITTSCPTLAVSASCPADRKYSSYVDDMTLTFYDVNNTVTTTVANARSVKISVSTSRKVFGKTLVFNNSIFTKLRN